MDISLISSDLLLFRGQYATIRAAHEEEKKRLQILCGALSSASSAILRASQPDDSVVKMSEIQELIEKAKTTLANINDCTNNITQLSEQRAELKPKAWGKQ